MSFSKNFKEFFLDPDDVSCDWDDKLFEYSKQND